MTFFDAHLHIIDPKYPLVENQGYLPEPFTCDDYLNITKNDQLKGGAVVSGSFQALDQSYLLDALMTLGSNFVGVTQLPETVSDRELIELNEAGVRALRFNVKRGGSENIKKLDRFAHRIFDLVGWHTELYIDSKELASISSLLLSLPAVSIDHLGLSKAGFKTLLKLAEKGVKVKATGFSRVDFDVRQALLKLNSANPDSLMFGTDLPSTRAPRPYTERDAFMILDSFDERQANRILYENAVDFYLKASNN